MRVDLMKHVGGYGSVQANIAEAQLVAHSMADLIETGPVQVVYANVNLLLWFGHIYQVTSVELVQCKASPMLVGPGYAMTGGVVLRVRATLHPHKL